MAEDKGSRTVSLCVSVCLGVCVWLFFPGFDGKMKSEFWTELDSASFLCLGQKPPEPGVGKSFPEISGRGWGKVEGSVRV